MARGELMKKLLASYGKDEEFRAVAEQIIEEEEQKNNRVLARSLRRTLESAKSGPRHLQSLAPLLPFPDGANEFVERVETSRTRKDIALTGDNVRVLEGLIKETRRAEEIRAKGLPVRSKLLLCGPPGCGKTLFAEVFSSEVGLPLFVVKIDRLISSFLGETAANVRKIFEFARKQSCVLFLDEFDALARSREDATEHNELRRVLNSLLLFIDRIQTRGFLLAATNIDTSLDPAIWRRFDEVLWFDRPDASMVEQFLAMKFRNTETDFDARTHASALIGYSYAELERICFQAMRIAIVERHGYVRETDFTEAATDEARRRAGRTRFESKS
jgi:SpoVK/Ycf46/Vps4 family AAA+-type ATPase